MIREINLNCVDAKKMLHQGDELEQAYLIGISNGLEELHRRTELKLLENISNEGLDGSKFASNISVEQVGESALSISINSEYAMFVEYGTGINGASDQHPMPSEEGWEYDTNGHGLKGWWYPTTSDDPNPYKWISEDDGILRAWTQGMASRPVVYNTWLWVKQSANNIIQKNINAELKKLR